MLFLSFLFSACGKIPAKNRVSEVDLNNKLSVQIQYRQFVYNCRLLYCNDNITISFCGNDDFPDGFTFVCDNEVCTLSYEGLVKEYNRNNLPHDYLPIVLKEFFDSFEGKIVTEGYNDSKECSYIKRTVNDSFVTLEVYNQGDKPAYNIIIN